MTLKLLFFVLCAVYTYGEIQVPRLKLNDGHEIPAIALGTWLGLNDKLDRVEPKSNEVEQAVKWALEAGYKHIDTAAIYQIEDQVGKGLAGHPREDVFVTTKLWNIHHATEDVVPTLRQQLQKLQLDYVDLYLIHWPIASYANGSTSNTDIVDTWRGMLAAKRLGLTRSIGVSNFNEKQIQRIIDSGLEAPAVNQVEINLNLQQPRLREYCKSKNIIVAGYTPFGSLFHNKGPGEAPPPRVDDPALLTMALKYNKTVPQIVLRYLVELDVIPLPKSLTKSRIEANVDIFDFRLTEDEKTILKKFDKHYRTLPQYKWLDNPEYPFEKTVS